MNDSAERLRRALERSGGNKTKAALFLDRWAQTVGALDSGSAESMRIASRRLVRSELTLIGRPRPKRTTKYRLRSMGWRKLR